MPSSAVEKAAPGAKRVLSGMIADTLDLATSKRVAVSDGQLESWFQIAENYWFGQGVAKDEEEGLKWFWKAADQGYIHAQGCLGVCYDYGIGVAKNRVEAAKWYSKAAHQGNAHAQYHLGICHHAGRGVAKDEEEAVKWFRKAAEQGNADAQCRMAHYPAIAPTFEELQAIRAKAKESLKDPAEKFFWMNEVNELLAKDPDFFNPKPRTRQNKK